MERIDPLSSDAKASIDSILRQEWNRRELELLAADEKKFWLYRYRKIFKGGTPLGYTPAPQPEEKRTEQGDCGDFITS